MKNLVWCDISGKILQKIFPSEHIEVQLHLVPLGVGLQVSVADLIIIFLYQENKLFM